MSNYHSLNRSSANRGVTLKRLKDEQYSLNMRMLLAMQCHSEEAQEEIKRQQGALQSEIEQICLGKLM